MMWMELSPRYRLAMATLLVAGLAACSATKPVPVPPPPPPPLEKVTKFQVELPKAKELPPVVGHLQTHRVQHGDTLLDIARDSGLGYREVQDANPKVDQWVPATDADVVVPTRFIVPRSHYRGIVINVPEMRLYFFPRGAHPKQKVTMQTWAVSIGVDEAPSPVGRFSIRAKDRNPTWGVPDSIYKIMDKPRRHVVPPGPDNPLGEYRLRLSEGLYAIHGTNNPWSIGRQSTNGCIRLYPEDLEILYPLVPVGTPVEFVYEPVKLGEDGGQVYVEVHDDLYKRVGNLERHAFSLVKQAGLAQRIDPERLRLAVRERSGVPVAITNPVQRAAQAGNPAL
jgi:L,D-transpeptidase ErfK/SrfK